MVKGTQYLNEGNTKLAREFYENCLKKNPDSPEVILALASLYDEHLNKPIQALFYYDAYLENPPPGADLELVRNARHLVYRRLGRLMERENGHTAALQKEIATLRTQNNQLKRYILSHRRQQVKKPVKTAEKQSPKRSR